MVQSKNALSLLVLPALALSSPGLHARHGHHHKAREINWVYTTEVVATTTVTYGQVPTPESKAEVNEANLAPPPPPSKPTTTLVVTPSPVAASPAPPAPPVVDTPPKDTKPEPKKDPSTSFSVYKPEPTSSPSNGGGYPDPVGGQFAIKNNCKYDVTMTIDRTMCGPIERDIPIAAGETWHGPITSCDGANPAYKIFKPNDNKPLQLEAGYKPAQKTLWYNISLKDCVADMHGNGIKDCPGGPWYLNAESTAADPGAAQTLQCHDEQSCCTKTLGAYCDAWATASRAMGGLEPVGGCLGDLDQVSLVAQIC